MVAHNRPRAERTKGPMGPWPLVGRGEELALLREMWSARPALSAVISGAAGVGKSRLAAATAEQAAGEGWATLTVRGSAGFSAVPLGPFRTLLRSSSASELSELTQEVNHALLAMRSPKGLLLLADDCQSLDESSAALLHHLVTVGSIVLIATARSGTRPHDALIDLWKDGLAERIELLDLSRAETTELISAGLGASVQDSSANRIWQMTGGNPLYLREVVLSSLDTGALKLVDGEWRWRGKWATGSRLQELVTARLGRLHPDELATLELLAVAGSLPLNLVTGLTTARAVEGLEQRALVATEHSEQRLEVAIANPLHAEVIRSRMPALQQRAVRRNLVDALIATGVRRLADRVRLACWSIESGLEVDPMTLVLGSDASLFVLGNAIAERLGEIMPEAVSVLASDRTPAVPQDHAIAVRLARTAYERTGGVAEGVALAQTLAWTGAIGLAEAALAEVEAKAVVTDDRLRLAIALGWVRFWGRFDVAGATECLLRALEVGKVGADRKLVAEIYQGLAGIALNTAQPALALEYAEQAAAAAGVSLAASTAAPAAATALSYLGRCTDALELVERAIPEANDQGHPLSVAFLLTSRAAALAWSGQLEQALELAEWLREVALTRDLLDSTASFGVLVGEILLRQGKPASAARMFRDATGLLAERDLLGYRPWALSGLARAKALVGDEESAEAALAEAHRVRSITRHYDLSCRLAESEVHALAGRTELAIRVVTEAADWARQSGMVIGEAQALDAWLRLAPSRPVADRLSELVSATDSELVASLAEHANALVDANPDALMTAAGRFAAMTAWWMAAEAAAAAARLFDRQHEGRAAKAALHSAAGFASRCEGARSSLAQSIGRPVRLTRRELELATLAAAGRSNKEIADMMYLSPRTVENHLYHVYLKLGVTERMDLAEALRAAGPK